MDEKYIEQADQITTAAIEAGIARVRARQQSAPTDFDGHCVCGDEIPKPRLDHGYFNCVVCQSRLEIRKKQFL